MAKKKKDEKKCLVVEATIFGVFDRKTRELVKVSLDEDEIEMDLALVDDSIQTKCRFEITLML